MRTHGVLLIALFLMAGVARVEAADDARPNVVVLITDDQRWDALSVAGHPFLKTPHIDRLAHDGVMFTEAFVTTAICCTSRGNLITGRYLRGHGVNDFRTPLAPEVLAKSLPAMLQSAGYRTGCLGKWGIGGPPPHDVFDVYKAHGDQGRFFHEIDGERIHNSTLLARRAEQFLSECTDEQPFFLLVEYKAPHEPFLPAERHEGLFRDQVIDVPATYSNQAFQAQPEFIRRSEGRTRLERRHPTAEAYQEFVKQYLRCVASVDDSVGEIMASLRRHGFDERTVVIFTSDHGFLLGEHGLSGKWLMYEESIRVPFIVRDPRQADQHGTHRSQMALSIDLAPTVLDLAGVAIPAEMDGRSLAPLLAGESPEWRDAFFYEHHYAHGGRIPRCEGVRSHEFSYIRYLDPEPHYEQLYDLQNDRLQQVNLVDDADYASVLANLRERYGEEKRRHGLAEAPTSN